MISVRAAAPRRLQSEAHHRYGDLFEIRRELGQENRLAFRDGLAETDPLIVVLNWFGGSLCAPDAVCLCTICFAYRSYGMNRFGAIVL